MSNGLSAFPMCEEGSDMLCQEVKIAARLVQLHKLLPASTITCRACTTTTVVQVGFPRRDPQKLQTALANTHQVVWIRCTKGTRWARLGQMLAFARATSDGALSATIWDVAVSPNCTHLVQLATCPPVQPYLGLSFKSRG